MDEFSIRPLFRKRINPHKGMFRTKSRNPIIPANLTFSILISVALKQSIRKKKTMQLTRY